LLCYALVRWSQHIKVQRLNTFYFNLYSIQIKILHTFAQAASSEWYIDGQTCRNFELIDSIDELSLKYLKI